MKYLFLFSVGPVQSFIAQARKTKDLFHGSRILSELIENAINEGRFEDVIFPSRDLKSKPNRFMAIVEKSDDKEVESFGNNLAAQVKEAYQKMVINLKSLGAEYPTNFHDQIRNALDIYWIALPLSSMDEYPKSYKEAEKLLASVKNYRNFTQINEPAARKCSLCGERNALYYKGNRKPAFLQADAVLSSSSDLDQGEALCAVCFSKRLLFSGRPFESTAEIALLDTTEKLNADDKCRNLLIDYSNDCGGNYDSQLLFKENLNDKYIEKNKIPKLKKVDELSSALRTVYREADQLGLKFSPYYAIFMADADNMGDWISGANLNEKGLLIEFQKALSTALGGFATGMKNYLDGDRSGVKRGRTIYAGGDDFLGFVNLNHLIPFMKEFRGKFDTMVNGPLSGFRYKKNITVSAGIVIAHYKTPLSEVLNSVRDLEKVAKSTFPVEKDAFALSVMKHSGEKETTCFKWNSGGKDVLQTLSMLINSLVQKDFSSGFINNIEQEMIKLFGKGEALNFNNAMMKTELNRLINRSAMHVMKAEENKEEFAKRKKENIANLVDGLSGLWLESRKLSGFLSFMSIAEFISRYLNGRGELR